jgi:Zn finger protein HypA/HybF involved in hydrogenase expression
VVTCFEGGIWVKFSKREVVMAKEEVEKSELDGDPVCEKCGSILVEEDGAMVCPNCDGEIDFLGDEEDES